MDELANKYIEQLNDLIVSDKLSEINSILESFTSVVSALSNKKKEKLHKMIVKDLIQSIQEKNIAHSKVYILLALSDNFFNELGFLREEGVFRASKYFYDITTLNDLIEFIKLTSLYQKHEIKCYFDKINILMLFALKIHLQEKIIKNEIRKNPRFLKTILAHCEKAFLEKRFNNERDPNLALDPNRTITEEHFASAVSYLVYLYKDVYMGQKIPEEWTWMIDRWSQSKQKKYTNIVEKALFICRYRELEVEVDIFNYELSLDQGKLTVKKDGFVEYKCIGDTKNVLQAFARQVNFTSEELEAETFIDLLDKMWQAAESFEKNPLYEIKRELIPFISPNKPIIRTVIPLVFHSLNEEIFSQRAYYKEELFLLKNLGLDFYWNEAQNIKLFKDIKITDIFLLQRCYLYLGYIHYRVYEKSKKDNSVGVVYCENLLLTSLLPAIAKTGQVMILDFILKSTSQFSAELIDQFTTNLDSDSNKIDLQYKPIIQARGQYLALPSILSTSNLIRSLALKHKTHLSVVKGNDLMLQRIKETLENKEFFVLIDFSYSGDQIEIDLIAYKEDKLFLFECKNPYYPTDNYELANTYHHVMKGFSQLRKIKNMVADKQHFKQFLKNIYFDTSGVNVEVYYGVINANKSLAGFTYDEFSVFNAAELIHFINEGTIGCMDKMYSCWQDNIFNVNDLVRYVTGKVLSQDMVNAREEFYIEQKAENIGVISEQKFGVNMQKLIEHFEKNYKVMK